LIIRFIFMNVCPMIERFTRILLLFILMIKRLLHFHCKEDRQMTLKVALIQKSAAPNDPDKNMELGIPVFGKLPVDPAYAEKADEGKFFEIDNPYLADGVETLKNL